MPSRRAANGILLSLTLTIGAACGDDDVAKTDGGHTGGIDGGHAAQTGGAGDGSMTPACQGGGDTIDSVLVDRDGHPIDQPLSKAVTVVSIDDCADNDLDASMPLDTHSACPGISSGGASRIVLAADGEPQWAWLVRMPGLHSDLLALDGAYDLQVDAASDHGSYTTVDQTVVISRQGAIVLAGAKTQNFGDNHLPTLDAYGVKLEDAGVFCETHSGSLPCAISQHTLKVTIGDDSLTVTDGMSGRLGDRTFTLSRYDRMVDTGTCDAKSVFQLGVFAITGS